MAAGVHGKKSKHTMKNEKKKVILYTRQNNFRRIFGKLRLPSTKRQTDKQIYKTRNGGNTWLNVTFEGRS